MADEESRGVEATVQVLGAAPVLDDRTMEDVLDKLKLLNYETDFCQSQRPPFKLLSKTYFANGSTNENASTQFFYFTSLVSWLMGLCGHKGFPPPQQFDDPSATSTNILSEIRAMGLPGTNLAPSRLRAGNGDAVLQVLTILADKALLSKGFGFRNVDYSAMDRFVEGAAPTEDVNTAQDDPAEIDDRIDVDSDDGEEMFVFKPHSAKGGRDESTQMIVSQVPAEQWRLEVERVGPQLQLRSDELRDWRARIEGATTLLKAVEKLYPDVKTMLQRMGDDLEKASDRVQKREQTLSQQFAEQVEEYRGKLRELNSVQEGFNQASQNVAQLSVELNSVSESLENTKREIEDREAKISDTSPLMQIKEAVTKVRAEIKQMSLRIGVLQHTVLHYTLRQSKMKREGRVATTEQDDDAEFVL